MSATFPSLTMPFDQQSPSCHSDGVSSTHQFPLKLAPGKFGENDICCHTDFDTLRVFLWYVYINTQLAGLGNVKEIGLHPATTAGIDQVTDIRVTGRDNSIERSVNLFKRLQRLKLSNPS